MTVRIRMKKMGRTHRAFFRICAMDKRKPRDGKVLEELGTYDPHLPDTDARAVFNKERVDYWLSVGAQPSENMAVLIKKYGTNGTHVEAQEAALAKLAAPKVVPDAGAPVSLPKPKEEEKPADEAPAAEGEATEEAKTEEAPAAEAPVEETKAEEAPAAEATESEAAGSEEENKPEESAASE